MKITNKLHLVATLLSLLLSPRLALATEMTGGDYIIKMGTITIGGGTKTGTTVRLTDTVGQTLQGEFTGAGYRTRIGFQYLPTTEPFALTIPTAVVDFGTVKPATFAGNSLDLTVNGADSGGDSQGKRFGGG